MKNKVEVSAAEHEEMQCDSAEEFKAQLLRQLDDAVGDDAGGTGADRLCGYSLDVQVV